MDLARPAWDHPRSVRRVVRARAPPPTESSRFPLASAGGSLRSHLHHPVHRPGVSAPSPADRASGCASAAGEHRGVACARPPRRGPRSRRPAAGRDSAHAAFVARARALVSGSRFPGSGRRTVADRFASRPDRRAEPRRPAVGRPAVRRAERSIARPSPHPPLPTRPRRRARGPSAQAGQGRGGHDAAHARTVARGAVVHSHASPVSWARKWIVALCTCSLGRGHAVTVGGVLRPLREVADGVDPQRLVLALTPSQGAERAAVRTARTTHEENGISTGLAARASTPPGRPSFAGVPSRGAPAADAGHHLPAGAPAEI